MSNMWPEVLLEKTVYPERMEKEVYAEVNTTAKESEDYHLKE